MGETRRTAAKVSFAVLMVGFIAVAGGISVAPFLVSAPITLNQNTVSCRTASQSQSGCLTSADWTTFNSALQSVTADSPLTGSGTSGSHLGCQTASGSQAGCLASADWTTFNAKQATVTASAPIAISANNVTCQNASGSQAGCVSTATQTFAGDKTIAGDAGVGSLQATGLNVTTTIANFGAGVDAGSSIFSGNVTFPSNVKLCLNGTGNCNRGIYFDGTNLQLLGAPVVSQAMEVDSTIHSTSTKTVACVALNGGTPATATVTGLISGVQCVCSEQTNTAGNATLKCAVSGTTLTITGGTASTDTICYICL